MGRPQTRSRRHGRPTHRPRPRLALNLERSKRVPPNYFFAPTFVSYFCSNFVAGIETVYSFASGLTAKCTRFPLHSFSKFAMNCGSTLFVSPSGRKFLCSCQIALIDGVDFNV